MNRTLLRQLAGVRVAEAEALLDAGQWSGAYYLVGYAVECGLKACIPAHVERPGATFTEKKFSDRCWTHDNEELLRLAGLKEQRDRDSATNPALFGSWATIKDWNELSRYQIRDEQQARKLFAAVTDPDSGVLPWITGHW